MIWNWPYMKSGTAQDITWAVQPKYWMRTITTDGREHLAGFVEGQTAAVRHIVIGPNGEIEHQW